LRGLLFLLLNFEVLTRKNEKMSRCVDEEARKNNDDRKKRARTTRGLLRKNRARTTRGLLFLLLNFEVLTRKNEKMSRCWSAGMPNGSGILLMTS